MPLIAPELLHYATDASGLVSRVSPVQTAVHKPANNRVAGPSRRHWAIQAKKLRYIAEAC